MGMGRFQKFTLRINSNPKYNTLFAALQLAKKPLLRVVAAKRRDFRSIVANRLFTNYY
jgi:hypothetical protein